jgi:hypothetical protein
MAANPVPPVVPPKTPVVGDPHSGVTVDSKINQDVIWLNNSPSDIDCKEDPPNQAHWPLLPHSWTVGKQGPNGAGSQVTSTGVLVPGKYCYTYATTTKGKMHILGNGAIIVK